MMLRRGTTATIAFRRVFAAVGPRACSSVPRAPPGPPSASPPPSPEADAVVADDDDAWLRRQVARSVAAGRQSPEAAAYFEAMLAEEPELAAGVGEARRITGGQDPERFTQYQRGQFAERLSVFLSARASRRLMRAHNEDQATRRHTQDGSPTGEDYWFEAGNTLSSPTVPNYVKDEIIGDMRASRPHDSSAFDVPRDGQFVPAEARQHAEHQRDKRRQLLSDADFGPK